MLIVDFNVENICIGQTDRQTDRQILYSHTDSTCTYVHMLRFLKIKPVFANNKVIH